MTKQIADYNITDHGVENSQYFRGHGIAFTDYDDTATGVGDSFREAFDDALDLLAQNDWNTDHITLSPDDRDNPKIYWSIREWLNLVEPSECPNREGEDDCPGCEDCEAPEDVYYYVSVDVKGKDGEK